MDVFNTFWSLQSVAVSMINDPIYYLIRLRLNMTSAYLQSLLIGQADRTSDFAHVAIGRIRNGIVIRRTA